MKFEIGEVLTRSWQITWKHKVLWLFSALPVLLGLLVFPIVFLPVIFMGEDAFGEPSFLEEPLFIFLFVGFGIVVNVLSIILYTASSSSVMLGVMRADGGMEKLQAGELFTTGRKYWLRILGVILLIGFGVSAIFLMIFTCMALIGAVTMGLGFICLQPLFLLMYPVMLILYGIIEEAQAAVVVDELGVIDALKRSWELVKSNFWSIVLISLIVYLGIGFLSSIVMMPFMASLFFIPFVVENQPAEPRFQTMMLIMGGFSLVLLPVMALLQGITVTFLKSAYTLTYLRLTRSPNESQPILQEVPA